MKTPLLDGIAKEAGIGSTLKGAWGSLPARATRGTVGKGLNLLFGGMMGGYALGHLGEIADKGPVGIESQKRWEADLARKHKASIPRVKYEHARRAVGKGGLLGAIGGAAVSLPFALKKGKPKNFILPLAAALIGRGIGRGAAERKHPAAVPSASIIDEALGRYAGLFSPEERAEWIKIRNSAAMRKDPVLQQQLAMMIQDRVKGHPEFKKWQGKQKTFSTLGKVLGGGAMLAAMLYGKKTGKGLLGKPGGVLSGNVRKAFAALGLGGMGLGIGSTLVGAKRAKLTPEEVRAAMKERLLSPETGMELGFYGNAFRKAV